MVDPYDRLRRLLGELFQFNNEDLDFGIYRIMNHKRKEISKFLNEDLLPQVREAFGEYEAGEANQIREQMSEIEQTAAKFNADPEENDDYRELKGRLAETKDLAVLESEVYSDLYAFFRRYYKDGDFLSLRRYKPGVYAVPYEGEEVKLYWANADQYYVKTTENFRIYRFDLEGVGQVNFDLVAAATERDNNKPASGKERRFVLREEDPVEEADGELHIYFEYRPHPDTQEDLRKQACDSIFGYISGEWKIGLADLKPTPSNKKRTLLEKHLAEYTARNTFDYFIHKDLGGFLRQELDFFLKSEVLHIDDLDTRNERRVEQYISKLKVIKRIGYKIIAFLAQIEDFQKKLFLKKKFVVSSDYCLTLDNIPKDLFAEIVANDAQYEEWERLFSISEIPINLENGGAGGTQRSREWLENNAHLVLDTKFFDEDFKDQLLASVEDLDKKTNGLLINSENLQALNLLQTRYREQVKCIYIDPPYNTGKDEFLYKDNYQHSSWLAMMEDRLGLARRLLKEDGTHFSSIDHNEIDNLKGLFDATFLRANFEGLISWRRRHNQPNDKTKMIGMVSEYILAYAKDTVAYKKAGVGTLDLTAKFSNPDNDPRGNWASKPWKVGSGQSGSPYSITTPTGKIYEDEWMGDRNTYERLLAEKKIYFPSDGNGSPRKKYFEFERQEEGQMATNWWEHTVFGHNQGANATMTSLFGTKNVFSNPKPVDLLRGIVQVANAQNSLVMDYFAGSGTTGHAVINLNREDGGSRKYILVEMGKYFDTVLKPRIQKAIYSKDWKDGKPVSREGTSHIFKYMTLESYEDTLNNLSLRRTDMQDSLIESNPALREEYVLSYMLDLETKGSPSLLNFDSLKDPSSYKLNITRGDETRPESVDLVETFNYLLGIIVSCTYSSDGYRVVEGMSPAGERVLVIWRNTREKSNEDLGAFFEEQGYVGAGFDHIYANGDNTLALKAGDSKVHLIEEEFRRLIFETEGF